MQKTIIMTSLEALVIKHIAGAGDICNFEEFGIILGYINIFLRPQPFCGPILCHGAIIRM